MVFVLVLEICQLLLVYQGIPGVTFYLHCSIVSSKKEWKRKSLFLVSVLLSEISMTLEA